MKTTLKLSSLFFSFILIFFTSCTKQIQQPQDSPDLLWFNRPADVWEEAAPFGNGRIGGMDFGQVKRQVIQLNEESLWAGKPQDELPENGKYHMDEFRKLILDGKYQEAYDYGMDNLTFRPTSFRSYQTLGNLILDFNFSDSVENYQRVLDMSAGIIRTDFTTNNIRIKKQLLSSAVDDVILMEISASEKNAINFTINLERQKDVKIFYPDDNSIFMDGQVVDLDGPDAYDDNPGGSGPGGKHMKFAARLYVETKGGTTRAVDDGIEVEGAGRVFVYLTAATDFNVDKLNFDRSIDPEKITADIIFKAVEKGPQKILVDHLNEHHRLFNQAYIDLGPTTAPGFSTYDRLQRVIGGETDPLLDAQYYQFGRYLLMSSSRAPGRLPANLQGIWNQHMWAPWEADYHLNINLQMNYWPGLSGNLEECFRPLTNYLVPHLKGGEKTARALYGSDGWVAHHAGSLFGRTTPSGSNEGSQLINGYGFALGGAWMSMSLYRYYEYTLDKEYLAGTVYPLLKGAADFIDDYLMEHSSGYLVTVPSSSPENNFIDPATGKGQRLTYGATMDNQIIRDVLAACISSATILEVDEDRITEWREILDKLPPNQIGKDGTIMEWMEDYDEVNPGHRHMSHLYGLHPAFQITPDGTPELAEAAMKTLERRLSHGGGHTGWSRAWLINFYARLWDSEEAYKHLQLLFRKSTKPNLFDNHPPFQIDGNFGGAASIMEMLVQSRQGKLYLLPALPEAWPSGKISGIKARGDIRIDMEWENGEIKSAVLESPHNQKISLGINGKLSDIEIQADKPFRINPNTL